MATKNTLRERIAENLKKHPGIESVWIEEMPMLINIYVKVSNVRNETLSPIFDMQYELESVYEQVDFNVKVNSSELEEKQKSNTVQKIF